MFCRSDEGDMISVLEGMVAGGNREKGTDLGFLITSFSFLRTIIWVSTVKGIFCFLR